jgi:hypothetical protein
MSGAETVGTLLADIANLINDGLRILSFADKRQWGLDEHEQVRALQEALDDAKKDFQDLPRLLNGQFHYERDRKCEPATSSVPEPRPRPAVTDIGPRR